MKSSNEIIVSILLTSINGRSFVEVDFESELTELTMNLFKSYHVMENIPLSARRVCINHKTLTISSNEDIFKDIPESDWVKYSYIKSNTASFIGIGCMFRAISSLRYCPNDISIPVEGFGQVTEALLTLKRINYLWASGSHIDEECDLIRDYQFRKITSSYPILYLAPKIRDTMLKRELYRGSLDSIGEIRGNISSSSSGDVHLNIKEINNGFNLPNRDYVRENNSIIKLLEFINEKDSYAKIICEDVFESYVTRELLIILGFKISDKVTPENKKNFYIDPLKYEEIDEDILDDMMIRSIKFKLLGYPLSKDSSYPVCYECNSMRDILRTILLMKSYSYEMGESAILGQSYVRSSKDFDKPVYIFIKNLKYYFTTEKLTGDRPYRCCEKIINKVFDREVKELYKIENNAIINRSVPISTITGRMKSRPKIYVKGPKTTMYKVLPKVFGFNWFDDSQIDGKDIVVMSISLKKDNLVVINEIPKVEDSKDIYNIVNFFKYIGEDISGELQKQPHPKPQPLTPLINNIKGELVNVIDTIRNFPQFRVVERRKILQMKNGFKSSSETILFLKELGLLELANLEKDGFDLTTMIIEDCNKFIDGLSYTTSKGDKGIDPMIALMYLMYNNNN